MGHRLLAWTGVVTSPNGTRTGMESEGGPGGWQDNGQEHAFFLTGQALSVPEPDPAAFHLLGVALAGMALIRFRRDI